MVKKLHIRKDDTVVVISGKDKGKQGKVMVAMPKAGKIIVEGTNMVHRHTKPRGQGQPGGIIEREAAIFASKVMLVCNKCNKATRIAYLIKPDGARVRVCKKCGAEIG